MKIFHNWYNANELRNYPLDDAATKTDINGLKLPDDFIADLHIWFPKTAGKYAFLSSAAISPGLVSVTFAAADYPAAPRAGTPTPPPAFTPLASLSILRPVDIFRNYALQAMYAVLVVGWFLGVPWKNWKRWHIYSIAR